MKNAKGGIRLEKDSERQRFEKAFQDRIGRSPAEFIQQKLANGTELKTIRYQYEMMAAEIARQNSCATPPFGLYASLKKKTYHKLVRDRIPEIIEASGKTCTWETLSDDTYLQLLVEKLNEELAEYQKSKSLEELADLLEVMGAVVTARGWTWDELTALRKEKRRQRGGFAKRILLKEVLSASSGHPQNAGKPWSKAEESLLLQEFRRGTDIPGLAQHHGRTEKAIRKRLELLGEIEACSE